MSERNTYCQPSPSWRHKAKREARPLGYTEICAFCGVQIHRAHLKSPLWWDNVSLSALPARTDPTQDTK